MIAGPSRPERRVSTANTMPTTNSPGICAGLKCDSENANADTAMAAVSSKRRASDRRSRPRKNSSSAIGAPTMITRKSRTRDPLVLSRSCRVGSSTSIDQKRSTGQETSGTNTSCVTTPTITPTGTSRAWTASPKSDRREREPNQRVATIGPPTNPIHSPATDARWMATVLLAAEGSPPAIVYSRFPSTSPVTYAATAWGMPHRVSSLGDRPPVCAGVGERRAMVTVWCAHRAWTAWRRSRCAGRRRSSSRFGAHHHGWKPPGSLRPSRRRLGGGGS